MPLALITGIPGQDGLDRRPTVGCTELIEMMVDPDLKREGTPERRE